MLDLKNLRDFYRSQGVPTILDDSYALLMETVKKYSPKRILEIGTATGMSAIAMSVACPTSLITTIEIKEDSYQKAKENFVSFGVADRINPLLGDSVEITKTLCEKYDFVFLDGSKSKYLECLKNVEGCLEKGAVIFADNVLFRGYIDGATDCPRRFKTITKNMREFLKYVFYGEKYDSEIFRTGDGVSISVYKG